MTTSKTVLPGQLILEQCIEPHGLTIPEAAARANLTVEELEGLIAGRIRLSERTAVRLERALGGSAKAWCRAQADLDLEEAQAWFDRTQAADGIEDDGESKLWFLADDWKPTATPAQSAALDQFLWESKHCPDCSCPRESPR